jgi:hypothetical protein
VAIGSVEPLRKLQARWGDQVQFVDILVRQAHPGPPVPPYHRFKQKLQDAQLYQHSEGIPWTVLVDDLQGTIHQAYGTLADPTYLIDREGRVAFYDMVTSAPTLNTAIEILLDQGGRGIVRGGWDRLPHLAPTLTAGWPALRRGLPQSFTDLVRAAPGSPVLIWLGYQLRPLLTPLTLRAESLPPSLRATLILGGVILVGLGVRRVAGRLRRAASSNPFTRAVGEGQLVVGKGLIVLRRTFLSAFSLNWLWRWYTCPPIQR